jgi:DNA-binding NarL/FixJ family response regulator
MGSQGREMLRILLADKNSTVRVGVRSTLRKGKVCVAVDEVEDRTQLMENLRSRDYEVLMIDPVLAGGTGESLIRQARAIAPKSNILVFTSMDELIYGARVVRSGAKGYLMKSCSTEELTTAVTQVGQGRMHISPLLSEEIANHLYHGESGKLHDRLTERELQVFSLLVCGKRISEAAQQLHLSVKTVSTHKIRIMQKLGISNLSEMIQYAISQGLMESCKTRCSAFCMT